MSTSPERAYHHGSLRAALLEEAMRQLAAGGHEALSLREVARAVGVTPAAVYRHFASREDLLGALAAQGFASLLSAQTAAAAAAPDALAAFNASGRAYVRFALARPALFRLMFGPGGRARAAGLVEAARAFELLLAQAVAVSGSAAEGQTLALRAWALVHGLAGLLVDGAIEDAPGLVDRLVDIRPFLAPAR